MVTVMKKTDRSQQERFLGLVDKQPFQTMEIKCLTEWAANLRCQQVKEESPDRTMGRFTDKWPRS